RFENICYSASVRRSHFEHRAAVVAASHEELASGLLSFVMSGTANAESRHQPAHAGKLAFVFSGMGPQWFGMGRELLRDEPVFRRAVEQCDALFRRHAGWSILDELLADERQSRMQDAEGAQPATLVLRVWVERTLGAW